MDEARGVVMQPIMMYPAVRIAITSAREDLNPCRSGELGKIVPI
jgi:hypothetical protein